MTDEEKQCKKKELDQVKEKTRINIGASFQRWREKTILTQTIYQTRVYDSRILCTTMLLTYRCLTLQI